MYLCLPELFDTAIETKYKTITMTLSVFIISCCLYKAENQVSRMLTFVYLADVFCREYKFRSLFNNASKIYIYRIKDVMIKDKHALSHLLVE